jgi:hypothetical protein
MSVSYRTENLDMFRTVRIAAYMQLAAPSVHLLAYSFTVTCTGQPAQSLAYS